MLPWLLTGSIILLLIVLIILFLHRFSTSWPTIISSFLLSTFRIIYHKVVCERLVRVVALVSLICCMSFITSVERRATMRVLLHLCAAIE